MYLLSFIFLLLTELIYFKVASVYNIIDRPNERSLHTDITIRGGGIVFVLAVFIYFIYSNFQYPFFYIGLFLIALISLWDDIKTLSNKYRIVIQFISIGLLCYQIDMYESIYYWTIPIIIVVMVGITNAYNFMDGINGITGGFSFVTLITLLYINNYTINFIEKEFIFFTILGIIIFLYFNFRKKAKCFAGDIGSVSIAFIILFLLGKLILQTGIYSYILLLTLYGVDSIFTILVRLINKENIFKAHKKHLYQILVYKRKLSHLQVTFLYCSSQTIFNIFLIINNNQNNTIFCLLFLSVLCFLYIYVRYRYVKSE